MKWIIPTYPTAMPWPKKTRGNSSFGTFLNIERERQILRARWLSTKPPRLAAAAWAASLLEPLETALKWSGKRERCALPKC